MEMDDKVAEKLSLLMLRINSQLNDSVAFVRDHCSEEDFNRYRHGIGNVMGTVIDEITNPLYAEHPALLPEDLGGAYKVDKAIYEPRFYEWE
jgi:hypothetical protein